MVKVFMEQQDLTQRRCKPCDETVAPLTLEESKHLLKNVNGWQLEERTIEKKFVFKSFLQAMAFTHKVAEIAEQEGHHPDISIHYNKVTLTLWTHVIGGLSENDFIVAAKIDGIGSP